MATNPMQRKARNSFLLGMLVTLIIATGVIALLFMQLKKVKEEQQKEIQERVSIYVLNADVKSGEILTQDMFTKKEVNKNTIPSNATSSKEIIDSYYLQDKDGNSVSAKSDKDGKVTLYIEKTVKVNNNEEQKKFEVKQANGKYYIEEDGEKKDIEFEETPLVAKVAMSANTVITPELVAKSDEVTEDDTRKQEYNTVILPMDLVTGDYIDIRLSLPSGQDYIVVAKKKVEIPQIAGIDSLNTIWANMSEDEILTMSNAIYDAYKIKGSKLYATKYTEPGMQEKAEITYVVNPETVALMSKDSNILEKAKAALASRYNKKENGDASDATIMRENYINRAINEAGEEAQSNVESGIEESITNSQESRKEYLDSLAGGTTQQ